MVGLTATRVHCWLALSSLSTRSPKSFICRAVSLGQLTLTYAGAGGSSIFCFSKSHRFLLLSSESSEKLLQLTEHLKKTRVLSILLTCGAGALLTGPSSNIGGGGGGGEGKNSSGAGGKGSSKGGGGGGNAQFEGKLASSPGGGGGGSGSSVGKKENTGKFGPFLTLRQHKRQEWS